MNGNESWAWTRRAALAGLAVGIVGAVAGSERARAQNAPAGVAFQDWQGQYGGGAEKHIDVIASADAWDRAWRKVDKAPAASFVAAMHGALLVALGQKMTGGFRVEVLRAYRDGGVVRVVLKDQPPAPDRFVTQAFADPWALVLLETGGLPIEARWQE